MRDFLLPTSGSSLAFPFLSSSKTASPAVIKRGHHPRTRRDQSANSKMKDCVPSPPALSVPLGADFFSFLILLQSERKEHEEEEKKVTEGD